LKLQREQLLADLKKQMAKSAPKTLAENLENENALYTFFNGEKVAKSLSTFFCLYFQPAEAAKETTHKQVTRIHKDDLVVCVKPGSEDVATENFLGIVDKIEEEKGLIVVKMTMKPGKEELTKRQGKMHSLLKKNTDWVMLRVCSLQNFTRSYQSVDSFNDCLLKDKLLDMTKLDADEAKTMEWCGMATAKKIVSFKDDLNNS